MWKGQKVPVQNKITRDNLSNRPVSDNNHVKTTP